ncbi:MAG: hypothetical protein RLZZ450_3615 [Pseudomonadota bacterium]|jgi:hypothetical protein
MFTRSIALGLLLTVLPPSDSREEARPGTQNPYTQYALDAADRTWLRGQVEQRIVAGHYVYLELRPHVGDMVWLVSLAATTPSTPQVRALVLGRAAHFHSPRLGRDFRPLLFAAVRSATP